MVVDAVFSPVITPAASVHLRPPCATSCLWNNFDRVQRIVATATNGTAEWRC